MSKYTILEDDTFRLGLVAIRSAKRREHERIHCTSTSKTIDRQHCDNQKRDNAIACQMCEEVMVLRKRFINNLVRYKKTNGDRTNERADL